MSGTHSVVVGDRGRLVIPAEVRDRAQLAEGTTLILIDTDEGILLLTRAQLRARVADSLPNTSLVGELLVERRQQAALEDHA